MKKLFLFSVQADNLFIKFSALIFLFANLILHSGAQANPSSELRDDIMLKKYIDTIIESKVDYIERIYFSGQNKEGLNNLILSTLQEFEGKPATAAVAAQYSFLSAVKAKTEAAENACDILELLAAGIYSFDVKQALNQGIPKPTAKVSGQLSSIVGTSQNISNNASALGYNAWILSNGSVSGYNTMSKLGSTAHKVSTLGNTISQGKQTVDQVKGIGKSMGIFKDKPCKSVAQKEIQIGKHDLPESTAEQGKASASTNTVEQTKAGSTITIKNINYNQLTSISSAIEKISGVTSISDDNFSKNTATFKVVHNMKTKDLVANIIKANSKVNFNVEDQTPDSVTLSIK